MHTSLRTVTLALILATVGGAALANDPASAPQPAKWVTRDVGFTYQGFTSQYSCDGLASDVKTILHALGARKSDYKVEQTPCASPGISQISLSPGVRGTVSVLVPATDEEIARKDPAIVPAHWKTVNLLHTPNLDTERSANCELLEQSKKRLLPLFTTRNLDFSSDCVPHEAMLTGMTFKVDVLKPDAKASESPVDAH